MEDITPESIQSVEQDGTVAYLATTSIADLSNAVDTARNNLQDLHDQKKRFDLQSAQMTAPIAEAVADLAKAEALLAAAENKQS